MYHKTAFVGITLSLVEVLIHLAAVEGRSLQKSGTVAGFFSLCFGLIFFVCLYVIVGGVYFVVGENFKFNKDSAIRPSVDLAFSAK